MSTRNERAARAFAAVAFSGIALGAGSAEAGIIIKKNGAVLLGRVDPQDVTAKPGKDGGKDELVSVTIHDPREHEGGDKIPGNMTVQREEIRWFDAAEWYPTDEYFDAFLEDKLHKSWEKYREDYRIRHPKDPKKDDGKGPIPVPTPQPIPGLEEGARRGDAYSIHMPKGWKKPVSPNQVLIFESEKPGTEGVAPRIQSFSIESPSPPPAERLKWVKEELKKLATGDAFELKEGEGATPKPVKGGSDIEWLTTTTHDQRPVMALRQIRFREKRTYFVSCYAHEVDYPTWSILFRAVLRTLVLDEEVPPARSDAQAVKVGQVYRWRSNVVPDQLHWEITACDKGSVTFRATAAQADGSKRTSESVEKLSALDPAARMTALTGASASPRLVGAESIAVSGTTFECSVYETDAGGARCRLWLSKKFPFDIKLTVADVLKQELVEIK